MISLPEQIKITGQVGQSVDFHIPIRVDKKGYKISFKPSCGCTVLDKEVSPQPDYHVVPSTIDLRVAGKLDKQIYYEVLDPQGELSNGQIILSLDVQPT
jgi:hypothetical protein